MLSYFDSSLHSPPPLLPALLTPGIPRRGSFAGAFDAEAFAADEAYIAAEANIVEALTLTLEIQELVVPRC